MPLSAAVGTDVVIILLLALILVFFAEGWVLLISWGPGSTLLAVTGVVAG